MSPVPYFKAHTELRKMLHVLKDSFSIIMCYLFPSTVCGFCCAEQFGCLALTDEGGGPHVW